MRTDTSHAGRRIRIFHPCLSVFICGLILVAFSASLHAAPREELLFDVNAALKTRDGAGFAHCFNFKDSDEATRKSFVDIIGKILAWPSFDVSTTERKESGAPIYDQGGHKFTLNGDWQYQIHIFLSKSDKKGFVFPAGRTADGKDRILVPVPVKSKPTN
jgi:hypothetical protein